jgi:hypothetical protein
VLGRKNYKQEELDQCKQAIQKQLGASRRLAKAIDGNASGKKAASALKSFEPLFFNNMTLALDRYFVHRLRMVTGKDSNPLNEVELLADSLMNNEGVLRANNAIKYDPHGSVVKLQVGDPIKLTESDFERLSSAFFAELESRFLERRATTTRKRQKSGAGAR